MKKDRLRPLEERQTLKTNVDPQVVRFLCVTAISVRYRTTPTDNVASQITLNTQVPYFAYCLRGGLRILKAITLVSRVGFLAARMQYKVSGSHFAVRTYREEQMR